MNINVSFGNKTLQLLKQLVKQMATVQEKIDSILAQVRDNNSLLASHEVLTRKIFDEVRALAEAQNTPIAGLDELEASVVAQGASIMNAIKASTDVDNLIPDVVPEPQPE